MSLFKHITEKPWERTGVIGPDPEAAFDTAPERVALVIFLVVASVIFSMLTVSYYVRMELPDWTPLTEPVQLWLNTGLLFVSSVLFQWARNLVTDDDQQKYLMAAFVGAGVFAVLFIVGQLVAWNSLQSAGHFVASNPATSFFYVLTGLHALHLLGGLWVWSKSLIRLLSGCEAQDVRLSIELCTLYWHFLLIVWLVMFAILSNT